MDELLIAIRLVLGPSFIVNVTPLPTIHSARTVTEAFSVALWRHRSKMQRYGASRSAISALNRVAALCRPPPQRCEVTLVGAGLAGLAAGCTFSVDGVRCALLEKSSSLSGVWRHYGNAFSRVNASEPGYQLPVRRRAPNTNHSYACEILVDVWLAIE